MFWKKLGGWYGTPLLLFKGQWEEYSKASVRDDFLWPQMLADNLKLDPVTLGVLNIIFNLGTNITNTIFWKYFLKNSCSSTIWGTLCSCISNFPPFETILMPPLQLSWFLLPSQKGRKVYSLFSVLSNSDPPSIVSLYGWNQRVFIREESLFTWMFVALKSAENGILPCQKMATSYPFLVSLGAKVWWVWGQKWAWPQTLQ